MIEKYYAVHVGRVPGVYTSWEQCEEQVKGYKKAKYKAFKTYEEALNAANNGWEQGTERVKVKKKKKEETKNYLKRSLSVDASCMGNPGRMEYQCVVTGTGKRVIKSKVFSKGTNNIGEFLALVKAMRYLAERKLNMPIYTDSLTALKWVENKRIKTSLKRDESTKELYKSVDKALEWLQGNEQVFDIRKWDTVRWGESKADYGRKS